MARKANDNTGKLVEREPKKAERNASGFYMYLGPNLKGPIQTGTIFRGDVGGGP